MAKKVNKYQLTLQQTELADGSPVANEPIKLDIENHDEIFGIVDYLQRKNPFDDPKQAAEFSIGLKLFSEVMIKNKNNHLFDELLPAFKIFMGKLKT
ncbi:MAG: DUF3861 family protein [Sphingobacteriaceae bacterium]|nr:MAG: DUF3861 family protein [Sphingobacteriaceae bacterium]